MSRFQGAHRGGSRPIVVYDSGVGGLTVARHLIRLRPGADLVYVADNEQFPYGNKNNLALRTRVYTMLEAIVETTRPQAIVVACNTASTAIAPAIDDISESVRMFPVIPPVWEASQRAAGQPIALLATPNTLRRVTVRRMIAEQSAPGQCTPIPSMELVHLAERKLRAEPVSAAQVQAALDPVISCARRRRIHGVILGCTHFAWLSDELQAAFPRAQLWVDPAADVAAHAIESCGLAPRPVSLPGQRHLWLTNGHGQEQLRLVFAQHGFDSEFSLGLARSA